MLHYKTTPVYTTANMEPEGAAVAASGRRPDGVILDISDIRLEAICRLCGANHGEKLVGIYSEEGLSNDLPIKMNMYLPVKVAEGDSLPLQCCWSCASTVLAWHDLVVMSVDTDRRLRELQNETTNQLQGLEDEAKVSLSAEHDERYGKLARCKQEESQPHVARRRCKRNDEGATCGRGRRRRRTDIDYEIFCDVCDRGFTRRFDMEKHRKLRHSAAAARPEEEEEEEGFACEACAEKFRNQSALRGHERRAHGVSRGRRRREDIVAEHFCDVCDKGFTRKHDMAKHRTKQHPRNEPPLPPITLRKGEERARFLSAAKIAGPDGKTYYKCKSCDKMFGQSYNLMRHQTIHTGVRAYFCHICGKNYPTSNSLKRHITEHHYGIKKFGCDVCGKRFAASATRNEHLNIHTNTRPFVCDVCGKSFKQKASLHTHKLFHTNDFKYACNVCEKKFRRNNELKVHTWLHTGHKPHKCHLCASSFRLKKDLRKHLRVHDRLNECACSECGSVFSQQKYLNNHKRTHRHKYVTLVAAVKSEGGSTPVVKDEVDVLDIQPSTVT